MLAIDGNDIGSCPDVLEAWCVALEEHPGLQQISLRDTGLRDHAARRIARALRRHSVLFSIDLSRNRITDQGVAELIHAIQENYVILEVQLEGTDATPAAEARVAATLARNKERFPASTKRLQELRRARAEAYASLAQLALTAPLLEGHRPSQGDSRQLPESQRLPPPQKVVAAADHGTTFFDVDTGVDKDEKQVFFDAGEGICKELSLRCDAGWRYNAADREELLELRGRIEDLKVNRQQENARAEEILETIARAQAGFNITAAPVERRLTQMKEEFANGIEATKNVLQEFIRQKLELKAAEEELGRIQEDRAHYELGAKKLESGLIYRNREVQEEVARLENQLRSAELSEHNLVEENERFRRRLHAARFETETERFAPRPMSDVHAVSG